MLNFGAIFECLLLEIVGGTPSPVRCMLASLSHCLTPVKSGCDSTTPPRVKYGLSKKLTLVGQNAHTQLCWWTKVHRTFFAERRKDRCRHISFPVLDISVHARDRAEFCMNFAPRFFFRGRVP